jgi:iron complex transport system substrate-binding protein
MPHCSPAALAAALLLLVLAATPTRAGDFTDAAGRRVVLPAAPRHVMAASPTAEVLVSVLAADRLAGASRVARRGVGTARRAPVIGWRPGMGPASMAETARRLHPDMIIDAGLVTAERAVFADEVQRLTGVPYILVDDSFARMPEVLQAIGVVLGVGPRGAELSLYANHAITALRGRLLIRPPDARPHIYYGRRADGLETPLPGALSAETIDEAGAINVAVSLGRRQTVVISRDDLLVWDPEIIIAEQRAFYDAMRRGSKRLAAVRNKRVYLAPSTPFGWIDDPPGINRLIGLYWLSALFYPDNTQEDLRATVCDFYDKFYRIKLTNGQLEAMVGPAGVPAPTPGAFIEPLVGLGAAPPSSLAPVTIPGTPALPSTPSPAPAAPETPSATPGTPATPNAPSSALGTPGTPSAESSSLGTAPAAPKPAASASCSAPTGMQALTGQPPGVPEIIPGVPPPGRRGLAPSPSIPGATPR